MPEDKNWGLFQAVEEGWPIYPGVPRIYWFTMTHQMSKNSQVWSHIMTKMQWCLKMDVLFSENSVGKQCESLIRVQFHGRATFDAQVVTFPLCLPGECTASQCRLCRRPVRNTHRTHTEEVGFSYNTLDHMESKCMNFNADKHELDECNHSRGTVQFARLCSRMESISR